jgi:hypothetical protein
MQNREETPRRGLRKSLLAILCVAAGALIAFAAYGHWKSGRRASVANSIPPLPKAEETRLREEARLLGRTLLGVTPDQEQKIEAIWKRLPRSVDELAEYSRKTDAVLTEKQRMLVRPIRRRIRREAIDRMLEPARSRFSPEDFEKFRNAIMTRVDKRIDG